jgi:methanol--5-hydroxybenzimidazolylcobamide Co-methyltransferase
MKQDYDKHGTRSTLRVTIADVRQKEKPAKVRTGNALKDMLASFEACATAGADNLSIESTGGKDVFDEAIVRGDIPAIIFSLGVLACRDVRFLWQHVSKIAHEHGILAGGDSACGFGNTAMQLAHQGYLPRVVAALVRAASAPRTLCAYEEGACGPGKDCAYENPVIKIITGVPIAMEGKSAACAHSSPLGNIAAALCDFWANESVQNVRLLGGPAPEVFTELLIYDCRLMNTAQQLHQAHQLRQLFVESDKTKDPQALFLDPEICFQLAERIVSEDDDYSRTVGAARFACTVLRDAVEKNTVHLEAGELRWLKGLEKSVLSLPDTADELSEVIRPKYGHLFLPKEYGLEQ